MDAVHNHVSGVVTGSLIQHVGDVHADINLDDLDSLTDVLSDATDDE